MTDIAALGFSIDSKPLADANKELDKTAASAKKAEKAVDDLSKSTKDLGASSAATAAAVEKVSKGVDNAVQAAAKRRNLGQYGLPNSAAQAAAVASIAPQYSNATRAAQAFAATLARNEAAAKAMATERERQANRNLGQYALPNTSARGGFGSTHDDMKHPAVQYSNAANAARDYAATLAAASVVSKQVANDNDRVAKSINPLIILFALLAAGVAAFGLAASSLKTFMSETDSISKAMEKLGETWSSAFDLGKQAATPLRQAIEDLTIALEDERFLKFVHVIGEALFGAFKLAVDGATALVNGIGWLVDNIDTVAVAVAAATAGAALLLAFGPAILSSVVALGVAGVAALKAIGAAVVANPFGALAVGIVLAVTALYHFRDEVEKTIGVDVIGIVKQGANLIIGSFVAAFEDIKFVWNNFGDVMGAAVTGGINLAVKAINALVKGAAASVDWLIDQVNKIPGVKVGKIGDISPVAELPNKYADRLAGAAAERNARVNAAMSKDYIGAVGDWMKRPGSEYRRPVDTLPEDPKKGGAADPYAKIVSGAQSYIALKNVEASAVGMAADAAARLVHEQELLNKATEAGIRLSPTQTAQLKGLADQMARADAALKSAKFVDDIGKNRDQFIATQDMERQALFLSSEAAAALRLETEMLNRARKDGVDQMPGVVSAIHQAATEMAAAQEKTRQLTELYNLGRDTLRGFFADLVQGLQRGQSVWDAFGNAALTALNRIADKLLQMAADDLWSKAMGGSSGGGGVLGGIVDAIAGAFKGGSGLPAGMDPQGNPALVASANGNVFNRGNVVAFARGGIVNRPTLFPMANGGTGLMGEAGEEAVMPLRRGRNGRLGVDASGAGGGGGGDVYVSVNNYTDASVSTKKSRGPGGQMSLDILVEPLEQKLASRMARGQGSLGKTVQTTFGLQPAGR
jgi:hypothetical protein